MEDPAPDPDGNVFRADPADVADAWRRRMKRTVEPAQACDFFSFGARDMGAGPG